LGSTKNLIAPPGQGYITIVLHVANAAADRPEPFPTGLSNIDWGSNFQDLQLWMPTAECANGGSFSGLACAQISSTSNFVALADWQVNFAAQPAYANLNTPIPAASKVDLLMYVDQAVAATAPLADVTVHWVGPNDSQNVTVPTSA
jgi:hypothetical protein